MKPTYSFIAALGILQAANAAITTTNLEVYYTFDDDSKSGTSYIDQWTGDGNADNSSRTSIATTTGKFGQAANTSTSGSTPRAIISAGSPSSEINSFWMPNTNDYTLSFWYKQDLGAGNNRIFNAGARNSDGSNDDGLQIFSLTNGAVEVAYHDPAIGNSTRTLFNSTAGSFTFSQWNHIAVVRTGTDLGLWVNGVETTNTLTVGYNIAVNTSTFFREPNFGPDQDTIANSAWDDTAIWHTALSDSEIAQIYNGGTGASIASLIPEPSTALLGALGILSLLRRRRLTNPIEIEII